MARRRRMRTCLGVFLAVVLALVFFGGERGPVIEDGSTLMLEVEGDYVEAGQSPWFSRVLGESAPPFSGLLSTFALAERDPRISTVVIVIRPLAIGWGKVGELRQAIERLGATGKHTVAYLEMASFSAAREYFLATAADEIWAVPGGSVPVLGLAAEYYFLGDLFAKVGITFDVAKAGRYKSAVERLTANQMSGPAREMANSLLDSTNEFFLSGIARGRDLSVEAVRAAIDQGPFSGPDLAGTGLVEGTKHLDAVLDAIGGPVVEHAEYAEVDPASLGFEAEARVALIYGSGAVVTGSGSRARGGGPIFAARSAAKSISQAAEDPSIAAIILRIDSPGGSALASEQIWRSLDRARSAGKPIIASFSDVAASGGYYAAVAADEIVANDAALTGSIGVFALRTVVAGGLEKLGVGVESLTRGEYAESLLSSRALSPSAQKRLDAMVMQTYALFVERVADGRGMEPGAVDAVGQGRVWTGSQAYEVGLVDHLGGLHTAAARVRAHLELDPDADLELQVFPPPRSLDEEIADALDARIAEIAAAQWPIPEALRGIRSWMTGLTSEGPLAVPPYLVEIR